MTTSNKYFSQQNTTNSVSSSRSPNDRSFVDLVFQAGKPPLDYEFQLFQEVKRRIDDKFRRNQFPSGFFRKGSRRDGDTEDFTFIADPTNINFVPNTFWLDKCECTVAGMPLTLAYTDSLTEINRISLEAPTQAIVKRTDFVFLEAWLSLVAPSPIAVGSITIASVPAPGDTVDINGDVFTAVAAVPGPGDFITGPTVADTAINLAAAINLVPVDARAVYLAPDMVNLVSNTPGLAGNMISLASSVPMVMVPSGAFLAGGDDRPNKPNQAQLYINGNTQADVAVCLDDDLMDPSLVFETAQRIQLQYRIRVTGQTEDVDYIVESHGFENASVLAMGGEVAPVAGYTFVPADNTTVVGNSSAVAYGFEDAGLWVAGDGSSSAASDLQTLDGFVYALPIAFLFRKNDAYIGGAGAGFDPENNTNGGAPTDHLGFVNPYVGVIAAGTSDRPDGGFPDALTTTDLMDLRRHVSATGFNYASELQWQFSKLMAGEFRTWAIDTSAEHTLGNGSGDVSVNNLICDEIGRDDVHGGNGTTSGTTTRGNMIRNFDHVARRFGDQPIIERLLLPILPTYTVGTNPGMYAIKAALNPPAGPGFAVNWYEGDQIVVDLAALNASMDGTFNPATISFVNPGSDCVSDLFPPNTFITGVLSVRHDDGHYDTAIEQEAPVLSVVGLGSNSVTITLLENYLIANGGVNGAADYQLVGNSADDGSPRAIFVELEISYTERGYGTSETPVVDLAPDVTNYPSGAVLENDITQRPTDMEALIQPRFRTGKREVCLEYTASVYTEQVVSQDQNNIITSRRIGSNGSDALFTDTQAGIPVQTPADAATEYGSSTRKMVSTLPLSGAGQTLVEVEYYPQDAIPNSGPLGDGYQTCVYYRTQAPQTAGAKSGALTGAGGTLPALLVLEPLHVSDSMWVNQSGIGTVEDLLFYPRSLEQIPVYNGNGRFYENLFFASPEIYIGGSMIESGFVTLNTAVPANHDQTVLGLFGVPDKDDEFRVFYQCDFIGDMNKASAVSTDYNNRKVYVPILAKVVSSGLGGVIFRNNEIVILVITQWYDDVDGVNTNNINTGTNVSCCFSVYRTKNLLTTHGE